MIEQEKLKHEILEKTKEYYALVHKKKQNEKFDDLTTRINYAGRVFDEKEMVNLIDSSLDFWLTYGKYSEKLESRLAKYLGTKWALLVNSGSSANLLAFMSLTSPTLKGRQIKRGDEVITVAAGFPTTIAPIVQYGAVPVFVDVNLGSFNIDVSALESARSPKTKAVMIAHTLGNPFDLSAVKKFCDKNNLWLIEDNCDALGSKYEGKFTGTFGDIGTSSFYPPHHITMGEGGATYTSNAKLKKIMLSLRDWGRDCWCHSGEENTCKARFSQKFGDLPMGYDHKYVYGHFGYNLKITDMQAAIGLAQMDKLDSFGAQRRQNFKTFFNHLEDLDQYFIFPEATQNSDPSWFGFLLTLREGLNFSRTSLTRFLEDSRIQTRNLFAGNILKHPCFKHLTAEEDYRVIGNLPNTDVLMERAFWLGVYPGMTEEKIKFMADKIREFVTK